MKQQTLVRHSAGNTIAPLRAEVKPATEVRDSFIAAEPWSPSRPETLVICCSDGRWHAQLEEFVRAEISDRADMYAIPGGPATFNQRNADGNQVAQDALRFLVQEHKLDSIWLIAHQNCAFYRHRYGPLSGDYIY
jgi:carbonic anhydrase